MKHQQREQQEQQQQEQQEQETQPGEERGAMTSSKKGKDKQKQPCSTISMGDNEGEDFLELKQQDTDLPEDSAKLKNQRLQELLLTKPGMRTAALLYLAAAWIAVRGFIAFCLAAVRLPACHFLCLTVLSFTLLYISCVFIVCEGVCVNHLQSSLSSIGCVYQRFVCRCCSLPAREAAVQGRRHSKSERSCSGHLEFPHHF